MRLLLISLLFMIGGCLASGDSGEVLEPQQAVQPPPVSEPPPTNPPVTQPPPVKEPPPVVETPFPDGIWFGQTDREGRSVFGVVQPDGTLWFLYSVVGAPDWAGGVVHGKMTVEGSTWEMSSGLYVNEEHKTRASIKAAGTFLDEQRLVGKFDVTYDPPSTGPPLFQTDGLDLIYSTRSERQFDFTQAAGRYVGLWIPLEEVEVVLATDGTITGRTAFGCTFSGEAEPAGPIAEATVTFDGPPCRNGHATVRGVLGVDLQADRLYAVGFSEDKNQGLLLIGRR